MEKYITFTGIISEQNKKSLLARSWAALQPSSIEGWGITVIEANACGTPVIASDVNGLKDSIIHNKTGFLVPVKSIDAFVQAMEDCIENASVRKNLSKNAYQWAHRFSWEKSADKFYSSLIGRLKVEKAQAIQRELIFAQNE